MIVLYNPRSTTPGKQPLPLSVLSLAAVIEGREAWALVDGNVTDDPAGEILAHLERDVGPAMLAVTVMPGPQLSAAVPVCRSVKHVRPDVPIVWGGYFPSQHADVVLAAPYVDFVVRSQGEGPFLQLLDTLQRGGPFADIGSLSWRTPEGRVVNNPAAPLMPVEDLPDPPYAQVPMEHYLHKTYLGTRTIAYNSSFGCPFSCSFCAVVGMARRRWLAQSPARMSGTLARLAAEYRIDAVQMHDMDFFISEDRVREFAERIAPLGLRWWGLGRVDTLMHYRDATWQAMARSGLKMVFSGAESPSAAVLAAMNKGGRSSGTLPLELAARMRTYGVVPEFSFVLGSPPDPEADLARTFEFIRRIKHSNPATEVVLYTYTPVPTDSALYAAAERLGFRFPATLEEWASERWRKTMLRRGDGIPWLDPEVRTRVRNFERVLNAFYPTVTDCRLTGARRALLRAASAWRYALRVYSAPYELRALHRLMRYQRPETTGF
jgi:anaerobic magnesium-protoporphyrin IX monomethyl ester cyclase